MELDKIYCGECSAVMSTLSAESIDLVVTSPPYGKLRDYNGFVFKHKPIIKELWRIMKPGGVVVWVIGDETEDGSEKNDSVFHKLYFNHVGFRTHDTMIYYRQPQYPSNGRYTQFFEYMFVFSKGTPRIFNPIKDKPNKYTKTRWIKSQRDKDGSLNKPPHIAKGSIMGLRTNVWKYAAGGGSVIGDPICHEHPAPFPEKLAADHIKSWSNPGDILLDPMCGSGTTLAMAAKLNRHFIGIDCSQEYCVLSQRRVNKYLLNQRLF
jgi:DNA modification methylase